MCVEDVQEHYRKRCTRTPQPGAMEQPKAQSHAAAALVTVRPHPVPRIRHPVPSLSLSRSHTHTPRGAQRAYCGTVEWARSDGWHDAAEEPGPCQVAGSYPTPPVRAAGSLPSGRIVPNAPSACMGQTCFASAKAFLVCGRVVAPGASGQAVEAKRTRRNGLGEGG